MHTVKLFLRRLLPIGLVIGGVLLLSFRIASLSIIFALPIITLGVVIILDKLVYALEHRKYSKRNSTRRTVKKKGARAMGSWSSTRKGNNATSFYRCRVCNNLTARSSALLIRRVICLSCQRKMPRKGSIIPACRRQELLHLNS